jgi:myo-inositol-1-phosphate synthase
VIGSTMRSKTPPPIRPAGGKLGVLIPGLGAVATTTLAGVLLSRQGKGLPVGSLTQMDHLERGQGEQGGHGEPAPLIKDAVPLAGLDQLEFGAWDIFPDDAYEAALHAKVLDRHHIDAVKGELQAIRPMKGAFYPGYVQRLHGTHTKEARSKAEMVEQLRDDVRTFKRDRGCDRLVSVWCGSTEALLAPNPVHANAKTFEHGLAHDDPAISNAQLYAWALLKERVPLANSAPNLCVDFPAARELARELHVPVAGKDLKTGQTLVKTILAPGFKARKLGLHGWYSTNILGNRDGEVLDDPESFKAKEASKLGVLESILGPEQHPDLYGDLVHRVRIDYYPPRGDAKEGWDSIDLFGWLSYPMQMKVNFLCRDSILAAPVVLDLILLLDLAERAGLQGTQEWLGFYFKSPMTPPGGHAEHDLFAQLATLKKALRSMAGAEGDG